MSVQEHLQMKMTLEPRTEPQDDHLKKWVQEGGCQRERGRRKSRRNSAGECGRGAAGTSRPWGGSQ